MGNKIDTLEKVQNSPLLPEGEKIYVYLLELEEGKYYVGKTSDPDARIENHNIGEGSLWTIAYKPIKIVDIIRNCDAYDEDKYTLKYMNLYGVENVRGGSFCKVNLSYEETMVIKQMLRSANNECYKCGNKGHLAINCVDPEYARYFETHEEKTRCGTNRGPVAKCTRCKRFGHSVDKCYAKTFADGSRIGFVDDQLLDDNST